MNRQKLIEKVREVAAEIASNKGLELVDVETAGVGRHFALRVYIDKPGGVNFEDCSGLDNDLGIALEQLDFIPSKYLLEISSPGLERKLRRLADFEKFVGSLAKVKMKTGVNGQKNFVGRIRKVENDRIFFDDKTIGEIEFSFADVEKANLQIDLKEELKRSSAR